MTTADAGSIKSEVRIALDKLRQDVLKVEAEFDKMNKNLNKQGDSRLKTSENNSTKFQKFWKSAFSAYGLAAVAAVALVTKAFTAAVSKFADTEQALANVRAVTQATDADFRKLEEAANQAGETTRFSASQAADALYNLGSAGFDAQQSIDSLNGVLLLAGATGSDLATTSQILTSAISQYGLEAEDATRVSNVFAAAIGNSQATISKLGTAFRQVGPIAGTLGISIEETTASLQALFNSGLQGEQAGTALRSILLDLSNSASPVVERIEAAGLAFDDFNPKAVGLTKSLEVLSESGLDLAQIFGKEAAAASLILADAASSTEENLRDLEAAVTGTNAAAEQYAIQNDTLAGTIDAFKSKLEALGNSIIGLISGPLRGLIDAGSAILSFVTSVTSAIAETIELNRVQKELNESIKQANIDIPALAEEYNTLSSKAFLSNEETVRQRDLELELLELIPDLTQLELDNAAALNAKAIQQKQANIQAAVEIKQNAERIRQNVQKQLNEETQALKENIIASSERVASEKAFQEQQEASFKARQEAIASGVSARDADRIAYEAELAIIEKNEAARIRFVEAVKNVTDTGKLEALAFENTGSSLAELNPKYEEARLRLIELDTKIGEANGVLSQNGVVIEDVQAAYVKYRNNLLETKADQDELNESTDTGTESTDNLTESLKTGELLAAAQAKKQQQRVNQKKKQLDEIAEAEAEALKQEQENLKKREEFQQGYADKAAQIAENQKKAEVEQAEDNAKQLEEFRQGYADKAEQIAENRKERELEIQAEEEKENEESLARLEAFRQGYADKAVEIAKNKKIRILEQERQQAEAIRAQKAEELRIIKENEDAKKTLYESTASALISLTNTILTAQLARIEKELEAELEAAGLQEKTEIEKLNAQLQKAIEAGDAETQAELKQEIRRQEIKEEYAKLAAKLELKAFRFEKALRISKAIIDTSAAIIGFLANPGGIAGSVLSVAAGVTGAAEIATISVEQPPSFETGGIVLGSGSSAGTQIKVAENGTNELMLNSGPSGSSFMNEFADKIAARINSAMTVNGGNIYLDGVQIAKNTVSYINKGQVRIK